MAAPENNIGSFSTPLAWQAKKRGLIMGSGVRATGGGLRGSGELTAL